MCRTLILAAALAVLIAPKQVGAEEKKKTKKPTAVTFVLHGAHCKACVAKMRGALKTLKGVKFKEGDIQPAKKPRRLEPRHFSPPFVARIQDEQVTSIGAFAEAIMKIKTPHAQEFPAGINLLLYPSKKIDEELIMDMRRALRPVNGLKVDVTGGLGGNPRAGYVWVRLENVGGAALKEVLKAAHSVDKTIKTTRPKER